MWMLDRQGQNLLPGTPRRGDSKLQSPSATRMGSNGSRDTLIKSLHSPRPFQEDTVSHSMRKVDPTMTESNPSIQAKHGRRQSERAFKDENRWSNGDNERKRSIIAVMAECKANPPLECLPRRLRTSI